MLRKHLNSILTISLSTLAIYFSEAQSVELPASAFTSSDSVNIKTFVFEFCDAYNKVAPPIADNSIFETLDSLSRNQVGTLFSEITILGKHYTPEEVGCSLTEINHEAKHQPFIYYQAIREKEFVKLYIIQGIKESLIDGKMIEIKLSNQVH